MLVKHNNHANMYYCYKAAVILLLYQGFNVLRREHQVVDKKEIVNPPHLSLDLNSTHLPFVQVFRYNLVYPEQVDTIG